MQPSFGNQNQVAAAMEYMKRRALADAIARGITIPQLGADEPRLPESMSAGGAAPPFWPGAQPQAQSIPQGGQPTQAPVPPVEIPQGAVSGATTEQVLPQGRLARVMQVLQNPQFAAMLGSAGQALGGPRMAGESQMQQISRAMAAGVGGAQNEQNRRMQMQQADWQREMEERKQSTTEAATAAEAARGQQQANTNELQVKGTLEQSRESLAQRKVESADEKAWRNRQATLQEAAQAGDWARHADLMSVQQQQLANEVKQLDIAATRAVSAVQQDQLQIRVALKKAQLDVLVAQGHLSQIAQETKDPRAKAKMEATVKIYGAMSSAALSDVRIMAGKSPEQVKTIFKGIEQAAMDAGESIAEAAYPTKPAGPAAPTAKRKVGETVTYKGKPHRIKAILPDGNYDLEEVK
jgi:hypothetical protein